MRIDNDPIGCLQSCFLCQIKVGMDSHTSYDAICLEDAPASGADRDEASVFLNARHRIACHQFHAVEAVIFIHELRQILGEDIFTDGVAWKDHRYFFTDYG